MFRLIAVLCLIHCSVSNIIRGRILLEGDVNRNDSLSTGSRLFIRVEQISGTDTSGTILDEIEISKSNAFPLEYQIRVPSDAPSALSYKLTVQIKKGSYFLYVGEETISTATATSNDLIPMDIPVRVVRGRRGLRQSSIDTEGLSWPELVGREGTYAVQYIKEQTGFTNVLIVPEDSAVTMDYRINRVRVFVNEEGIVIRTPRTG